MHFTAQMALKVPKLPAIIYEYDITIHFNPRCARRGSYILNALVGGGQESAGGRGPG